MARVTMIAGCPRPAFGGDGPGETGHRESLGRAARLMGACVIAAALTWSSVPAVAATTPSPSPSPPVSPAPAPTADPLALQLQQQLAQQAALDATKQSLAATVAAAQGQHGALTSLIAANQQAIPQTLAQLADAEQRYQDASSRQVTQHAAAVQARKQERADKAELAFNMRQRYVSQDTMVSYVLASKSISEVLSRTADVTHLVDHGETLVRKVQQDLRTAAAAEAAALESANAAQLAAAQLSYQEQQLQAQTRQAQQLIVQLSAQEQAAAHEIILANGQSLAVAQQIAATRIAELDATISAAQQTAWQAASYWIQQHLGALPPGFAQPPPSPGTAHFVWPAPGSQLVQPFGPSPYAFEPPFAGYPHFHTGIDLTRGAGSPILAAAGGVVVSAAFNNDGYGNHIIIAHAGGFLTLYAHLEAMLVQPGDTVQQGQLIGLMGTTGNSTGPHLHFEVRFNTAPVDPIPFLPPLPPGASGPP